MTPKQTLINFPEFADNGTKAKPDDAKYAQGFLPADVLPAQWTNYFFNGATKGITDLNTGIISIEEELINVLTAAGIEPATATKDQVLTAIQTLITNKTGTLSNLVTTAKETLVAAVNEVKDQANNLMKAMYPVGSIKISENNVNPGTYIPNTTWELKSSGRVLQGADETHNGGDTIEAGLPNITGSFSRNVSENITDAINSSLFSGAFGGKNGGSRKIAAGTSGSYNGYKDITFKASLGETKTDGTLKTADEPHVYGNSDTVQPAAYVVYIWKRTA